MRGCDSVSLLRINRISPLVLSNNIRYSSSSLKLSSNGSSRKSQYCSLRSASDAGSIRGSAFKLSAKVDGRTSVKPNMPLFLTVK